VNKVKYSVENRKEGYGHDVIISSDIPEEQKRFWKYYIYSKINRKYKNLLKYIPKELPLHEK